MFFSYNEEDYNQYVSEGYDIDDSMELMVESYINDYTIFESVLRRDFMEATGLLTEASDDNFLVKIWNKIKEFIEMIHSKIMGLIQKFIDKMDEIKKNKCKKIVDEYKKYYSKEKGELNEFTIKNFKLRPEIIIACGQLPQNININNIMKKEFKASIADMPYVDQLSKDQIDQMADSMDEISSWMPDLKDLVEKIIYSEDEIERPFSGNKAGIVKGLQSIIIDKTDDIRTVKDMKKDFVAQINKCRKDAKKQLSEIRKDKYSSKETKDKEKEKAHAYLKMMSGMKKFVSSVASYLIKEIGKIFKDSVRLYQAGGEFIKKAQDRQEELKKARRNTSQSQEESATYFDADYNTAIGEMAVFDLGLEL